MIIKVTVPRSGKIAPKSIPAFIPICSVVRFNVVLRLTANLLNEAIWKRLEAFNNKPFQKKNGSRASLFAEEKPFLRPLPPYPFELATWKKATVGPNYHISVERMNYSVPFEYIRQKVDVRLTRATVEVFYNGSRI